MQIDSPLIVTVAIDEETSSFFNALRKQYFPPALNYIDAHLTLFHHLPSNESTILDDLQKWSTAYAPIPLQITEIKSIGKGVAYKIDSPALSQLHRTMQTKWKRWLTPQDSQKLWPHITVQNKVPPAQAKETLQILQASFQPFTATALGFELWAYKGGPWEYVNTFLFKRNSLFFPEQKRK
ncbi:MAG TPA: 2'-5' RNA ligase family protein [Flavisolibacter sp.]|jgi:2'-5' RNA ligase|nr:2'-5' RNA ligase family protein [Flavisolibacter sp.]